MPTCHSCSTFYATSSSLSTVRSTGMATRTFVFSSTTQRIAVPTCNICSTSYSTRLSMTTVLSTGVLTRTMLISTTTDRVAMPTCHSCSTSYSTLSTVSTVQSIGISTKTVIFSSTSDRIAVPTCHSCSTSYSTNSSVTKATSTDILTRTYTLSSSTQRIAIPTCNSCSTSYSTSLMKSTVHSTAKSTRTYVYSSTTDRIAVPTCHSCSTSYSTSSTVSRVNSIGTSTATYVYSSTTDMIAIPSCNSCSTYHSTLSTVSTGTSTQTQTSEFIVSSSTKVTTSLRCNECSTFYSTVTSQLSTAITRTSVAAIVVRSGSNPSKSGNLCAPPLPSSFQQSSFSSYPSHATNSSIVYPWSSSIVSPAASSTYSSFDWHSSGTATYHSSSRRLTMSIRTPSSSGEFSRTVEISSSWPGAHSSRSTIPSESLRWSSKVRVSSIYSRPDTGHSTVLHISYHSLASSSEIQSSHILIKSSETPRFSSFVSSSHHQSSLKPTQVTTSVSRYSIYSPSGHGISTISFSTSSQDTISSSLSTSSFMVSSQATIATNVTSIRTPLAYSSSHASLLSQVSATSSSGSRLLSGNGRTVSRGLISSSVVHNTTLSHTYLSEATDSLSMTSSAYQLSSSQTNITLKHTPAASSVTYPSMMSLSVSTGTSKATPSDSLFSSGVLSWLSTSASESTSYFINTSFTQFPSSPSRTLIIDHSSSVSRTLSSQQWMTLNATSAIQSSPLYGFSNTSSEVQSYSTKFIESTLSDLSTEVRGQFSKTQSFSSEQLVIISQSVSRSSLGQYTTSHEYSSLAPSRISIKSQWYSTNGVGVSSDQSQSYSYVKTTQYSSTTYILSVAKPSSKPGVFESDSSDMTRSVISPSSEGKDVMTNSTSMAFSASTTSFKYLSTGDSYIHEFSSTQPNRTIGFVPSSSKIVLASSYSKLRSASSYYTTPKNEWSSSKVVLASSRAGSSLKQSSSDTSMSNARSTTTHVIFSESASRSSFNAWSSLKTLSSMPTVSVSRSDSSRLESVSRISPTATKGRSRFTSLAAEARTLTFSRHSSMKETLTKTSLSNYFSSSNGNWPEISSHQSTEVPLSYPMSSVLSFETWTPSTSRLASKSSSPSFNSSSSSDWASSIYGSSQRISATQSHRVPSSTTMIPFSSMTPISTMKHIISSDEPENFDTCTAYYPYPGEESYEFSFTTFLDWVPTLDVNSHHTDDASDSLQSLEMFSSYISLLNSAASITVSVTNVTPTETTRPLTGNTRNAHSYSESAKDEISSLSSRPIATGQHSASRMLEQADARSDRSHNSSAHQNPTTLEYSYLTDTPSKVLEATPTRERVPDQFRAGFGPGANPHARINGLPFINNRRNSSSNASLSSSSRSPTGSDVPVSQYEASGSRLARIPICLLVFSVVLLLA